MYAFTLQRTPYRFTSKELDEETGLYYFGARYYDPRTSVWQSADPILEQYLPKTPIISEDIVNVMPISPKNPVIKFDLPGLGGVFESKNLNVFAYSHQNPVRYVDPDGRETKTDWNVDPKIDVNLNEGERTIEVNSVGVSVEWTQQTTRVEAKVPTTDPFPTGQEKLPNSIDMSIPSEKDVAKQLLKHFTGEHISEAPPVPGQPQLKNVETSFISAGVKVKVNTDLQYRLPEGSTSFGDIQRTGEGITDWSIMFEMKIRH